jgi:hypothetical protein
MFIVHCTAQCTFQSAIDGEDVLKTRKGTPAKELFASQAPPDRTLHWSYSHPWYMLSVALVDPDPDEHTRQIHEARGVVVIVQVQVRARVRGSWAVRVCHAVRARITLVCRGG